MQLLDEKALSQKVEMKYNAKAIQRNEKNIRILLILMFFSFFNMLKAGVYVSEKRVEDIGNVVQLLIPTSAYITTYLLDDDEGRNQFYKSFFTNIGITYSLKYSVNKQRPENNGDYSFPSGHTSASFQGATFIHKRYGFKYSIPAYIGAMFVGWSRDESDKHDYTDIVSGAVIGILSSYYFTKEYEGLVISATADNSSCVITLSKAW